MIEPTSGPTRERFVATQFKQLVTRYPDKANVIATAFKLGTSTNLPMNSSELRKAGFHATADAMELFEIVEQEHRNLERKYNELIMAVASKWPGETRHQTALRYITQRESLSSGADAEAKDASPSERNGARVET